MPQASPVWQTGFLVWSLVCIGWMIFSGWRSGIVRGVLSLAALFLAYSGGAAASHALPNAIKEAIPLPLPIAGMVFGVAIGVAIFVTISLISSVLFKRTGHQRSLLMRLLWGGGGAICGLVFGVLLVLVALSGIRMAGTVAEAKMEQELGQKPGAKPSAVSGALVKLKRSIEAGETGSWLATVDITPDSTYRVVTKTGRVLADRNAILRMSESPALERLLMDRVIVNLGSDPEINEAVVQGNYGKILANPKVLKAAQDPELIKKLQEIDWEAELDGALSPQSGLAPPENLSR